MLTTSPCIDLPHHDAVCVSVILKPQLHLPAEVANTGGALLNQAAHNIPVVDVGGDQGNNRLQGGMIADRQQKECQASRKSTLGGCREGLMLPHQPESQGGAMQLNRHQGLQKGLVSFVISISRSLLQLRLNKWSCGTHSSTVKNGTRSEKASTCTVDGVGGILGA